MTCERMHRLPALEVLGEMSFRPAFKPWELKDNEQQMIVERTLYKEQKALRCIDVLHQAAYRFVFDIFTSNQNLFQI